MYASKNNTTCKVRLGDLYTSVWTFKYPETYQDPYVEQAPIGENPWVTYLLTGNTKELSNSIKALNIATGYCHTATDEEPEPKKYTYDLDTFNKLVKSIMKHGYDLSYYDESSEKYTDFISGNINVSGDKNVNINSNGAVADGQHRICAMFYLYGPDYEITLKPLDKDGFGITTFTMAEDVPPPSPNHPFNITCIGDSHTGALCSHYSSTCWSELPKINIPTNVIPHHTFNGVYFGPLLCYSYATKRCKITSEDLDSTIVDKLYQSKKININWETRDVSTPRLPFIDIISQTGENSMSGQDPSDFIPMTGNDMFVFCLGEIDCRCHVKKHISETKTWKQVIMDLVDLYIKAILQDMLHDSLQKVIIKNTRNICVFNVPPPRKEWNPDDKEFPLLGTAEERRDYAMFFNEYAKMICEKHFITFIDVYREYSTDEGYLNTDLSDENIHLLNPIPLRKYLEENVTSYSMRSSVFSNPDFCQKDNKDLYLYVHSGLNNKLIPLFSLLRIARKEQRTIKCYWGEDAYCKDIKFQFEEMFESVPGIRFIKKNQFVNSFFNKENIIYNKNGSDRDRNEIIYDPTRNPDDAHDSVFYKIVHSISYKEDNVVGNYVPYPKSKLRKCVFIDEMREVLKDLIPAPPIKQRIEETKALFSGKHSIGIHVRSTDGGFVDVPKYESQDFIRAKIEEHPESIIYISCDTHEIENKIIQEFPQEKIYFYGMDEKMFGKCYGDKFNRFTTGTLNAVVEMFVLASCDVFYGTPGSSLSFMTWLLRNDDELDFWCDNPWK